MADFTIKQGDRLPSLTATLYDANNAVVDLSSGVTGVTFSMRRRPQRAATITNEDAVIVDAETGQVRYDWAAGDTATAGDFEGEFTVNYTSGQSLTFPNFGYIGIYIESQIA